MARYYDIDKLKEMIEAKANTLIEGKEAFLCVAKWLELLPPADVVEVVRCKDCIFGKADTEGSGSVQCSNRDTPWHRYNEDFAIAQNDFCRHGERKST